MEVAVIPHSISIAKEDGCHFHNPNEKNDGICEGVDLTTLASYREIAAGCNNDTDTTNGIDVAKCDGRLVAVWCRILIDPQGPRPVLVDKSFQKY